MKRYQDRDPRGIKTEVGYKNGKKLEIGDSTKGSTRLDIYDESTETVYDYKFVTKPGKGLKPRQIEKIKTHGPQSQKAIKEVNPTMRKDNVPT